MIEYKVLGGWPFPLDMLRYDDSRAATPEDQALIDKLSSEDCPDDVRMRDVFTVTLVADARRPTPLQPCAARWRSFLWSVTEGACWSPY